MSAFLHVLTGNRLGLLHFNLACAMNLVKVTLMMYFRVSTPIRYTIIKDYA